MIGPENVGPANVCPGNIVSPVCRVSYSGLTIVRQFVRNADKRCSAGLNYSLNLKEQDKPYAVTVRRNELKKTVRIAYRAVVTKLS
jgi:hypothetical protein